MSKMLSGKHEEKVRQSIYPRALLPLLDYNFFYRHPYLVQLQASDTSTGLQLNTSPRFFH